MFFLECSLAQAMLFDVMVDAKTDHPSVGRLEPGSPVGPAANVSTFNGERQAAGHRAMVLSHPGPMRWAGARACTPRGCNLGR